MGFLIGLPARLRLWAGIAVAALAAFAYAYFKGRREGAGAIIAKRAEANAERQAEFDQIDAQRPDFDASVDRLHDRSRRRGPGAP